MESNYNENGNGFRERKGMEIMKATYNELAYTPQEILWNTCTAYVPGFYEAEGMERETMLEDAARDLVRLINRKGYDIDCNGNVAIPGCDMDSYAYMDEMESLEIAFGRCYR